MEKIQITPEMKLTELLEDYPELEDKLIKIAPPFKKLKNKVLRKTLAKVTTLRQVSTIASISLAELINNLRTATGQNKIVVEESQTQTSEKPDWVVDENIKMTYDARIDLENGKHPVSKVTKEMLSLKNEDLYLLITPFFPGPLIDIVKEKGFKTYSTTKSVSEVHTFIKQNK